jgi:hypothetical protein
LTLLGYIFEKSTFDTGWCVVRPSHRHSLLTELLTGNAIQTDASLCGLKR